MKATVVLYDRQTHVQFFDPDSHHFHVINHPSHWTRSDARLNVDDLSASMGMYINSTYSETNELGEYVECFFLLD